MGNSRWSCVLWDVDGTIADASRGILPRVAQVLDEQGHAPIDAEHVNRWIGPPMLDSFQQLAGLSPDDAARAVRRYRELAGEHGYASSVRLYDGVVDVIRAVGAAGIPQSTASTKPQNQIEAIFAHFAIADLFVSIHGAIPDPETLDTKSHVLGRALDDLRQRGVDVSRPVLIGDRSHDLEGAADHDVPVIFARWGFGDDGEEAGAFAVAHEPEDLRDLLLSS